ncbi:uncharacterized protein LOC143904062 isoform X2 [Temnothorax americanus]|uniref:uncharacterized protein LOC143904062 isoform X2 n=1 Tax=Temnothorax americanus TaxID=1964332 RepID=UPI0040693C1F
MCLSILLLLSFTEADADLHICSISSDVVNTAATGAIATLDSIYDTSNTDIGPSVSLRSITLDSGTMTCGIREGNGSASTGAESCVGLFWMIQQRREINARWNPKCCLIATCCNCSRRNIMASIKFVIRPKLGGSLAKRHRKTDLLTSSLPSHTTMLRYFTTTFRSLLQR